MKRLTLALSILLLAAAVPAHAGSKWKDEAIALNYPSVITVTTEAQFYHASRGWQIKSFCGRRPDGTDQLKLWQYLYCHNNKQGNYLPKPRIVLAR